MEEILRHLARGWQGFVGVMAKATADKVKLSRDELERLERLQAELAEVIRRQREMNS